MKEQRVILEPFELLDVLECKGEIQANCHGSMLIRGHINQEKEQEYIQMLLTETWGSVKVRDENGKEEILFSGIVTEGDIMVENGLKTLSVTMNTGSFLMDLQNHLRTFQNRGILYAQIMDILMEAYTDSGCIMSSGRGKSIEGFLCQYQETDWQFALRLSGRCHTVLYPNYIGKGAKVYFGMPRGKNRGEINATEYCQKQAYTMSYSIKVREILDIGDSVIFQGRKLYVVSRNTKLEHGELYHIYEMMLEEKESLGVVYNDNISGVSLNARVVKVEETNITVSFKEDENKNACGSRWFPFATVYSSLDGTGWYCMPEIGDNVRIYFPSNKEEEAYAFNAMHMKSTDSRERTNPDYKSLMNKQGKEILFRPDSILITNNAGMSLELSDNEGISIISDKKIILQSEEAIEITSVNERVDIVAPQQIALQQGNTQMVLSDNLTMRGAKIRLD